MASPPPRTDHGSAGSSATSERPDDDGSLERVSPGLVTSIRAAGFWAAIGMPVLYVPLLATGLSSSLDGVLFLGLVVGHLFALYVGHSHRR